MAEKVLAFLIALPVVLGIYALQATAVYFLWNATLPHLFAFSALTWWQAVAVFLLCSFLFKSRETK